MIVSYYSVFVVFSLKRENENILYFEIKFCLLLYLFPHLLDPKRYLEYFTEG
jgi:hypothetical protein